MAMEQVYRVERCAQQKNWPSPAAAAIVAPMDKLIRNHAGERLDHAFHPGIGRGSKTVVVIGHGVTANMDRAFITTLAESLSMVGISTLRFSFAGNGNSEGRFEESCISKEVRELGAVVDALDGRPVIYAGHSMGGAVGVLFAAQDRRLKGLISLAGMVHTQAFVEREFAGVKPGAGFMWDKPNCPLSAQFMADMDEIDSVLDRAPKIKVPWLLVHGVDDDVVPVTDSREIIDYGNEPKELFEIPRCDHVFDPVTDGDALPAMVTKVTSWVLPLVEF